jgi:membrane protease YdiL (CAAX protease family)
MAAAPDHAGQPSAPLDEPRPTSASLWRLSGATLLDAVIAVTVVFAGSLIIGLMLGGLRTAGVDVGPPGPGIAGMPAILIPLALLATLGAGVTLWLLHRRRLPSAPRPWTGGLFATIVLAAVAIQALAFGYYHLVGLFGLQVMGTNIDPVLSAYNASPLLTALMVVIAAPVGEELLFRRVCLHRFAQAGRPQLGLVLSSTLFALLHQPLPGERGLLVWLLMLVPYAAIGGVLGQLYLRTGRIEAPILGHAIINALGIATLAIGSR